MPGVLELGRESQHRCHRDEQQRCTQHRAHPKAPRQVAQLRIVLDPTFHRHERHAALRARAGADLHDLRVHRAGVPDTFLCGLRVLCLACAVECGGVMAVGTTVALRITALWRQILFGVGAERMQATLRAKVVGRSLVLEVPRRLGRIHRHAANGIECHDQRARSSRIGHSGRSSPWQWRVRCSSVATSDSVSVILCFSSANRDLGYSRTKITFTALTSTRTESPFFTPRSARVSSVMTEVISIGPSTLTLTWLIREPFLISATFPTTLFRAPYFMQPPKRKCSRSYRNWPKQRMVEVACRRRD